MINSGPGRSGLSGKSILPSEELRPAALRPLCRGTSSVAVSHTGKINPLGGTDPRALSDLGTRPEGGTVCGHCPDTLPLTACMRGSRTALLTNPRFMEFPIRDILVFFFNYLKNIKNPPPARGYTERGRLGLRLRGRQPLASEGLNSELSPVRYLQSCVSEAEPR